CNFVEGLAIPSNGDFIGSATVNNFEGPGRELVLCNSLEILKCDNARRYRVVSGCLRASFLCQGERSEPAGCEAYRLASSHGHDYLSRSSISSVSTRSTGPPYRSLRRFTGLRLLDPRMRFIAASVWVYCR